jgi:hypothetical protein
LLASPSNHQPTTSQDKQDQVSFIMGRMHSNGKGISSSAIPYSRVAPAWVKATPESVVEQILKLARKGATPSQIGTVLRDSHGIAQVGTRLQLVVPEESA